MAASFANGGEASSPVAGAPAPAPAARDEDAEFDSETEPLLLRRVHTQASTGKMCAVTVVAFLAFSWCVVDSWNHEMSSQLFGMGRMKNVHVNMNTGDVTGDISHFEFPLTLALMQFVFMGTVFLGLWWLFAQNRSADLSVLTSDFWSGWPGLAVSYVFSTFWLQSMMMPSQMMSIGIFAASRAVEVPAVALIRSQVIGAPYGGHPLATTACLFMAIFLLFYSYTQIAECLCIWSGHGVALSGVALYAIYSLVLVFPAVNAVCQELVLSKTNWMFVLGVQNALAALIFAPVLFVAHFSGWENVGLALQMVWSSRQVTMVILWLCIQMALISAVGVAVISMLDSYWAVALRSMKVVYWWCSELFLFYFMSNVLLSIAKPSVSFWSFAMLCAVILGGVAMLLDRKLTSDKGRDAMDAMLPSTPGTVGVPSRTWKEKV